MPSKMGHPRFISQGNPVPLCPARTPVQTCGEAEVTPAVPAAWYEFEPLKVIEGRNQRTAVRKRLCVVVTG